MRKALPKPSRKPLRRASRWPHYPPPVTILGVTYRPSLAPQRKTGQRIVRLS